MNSSVVNMTKLLLLFFSILGPSTFVDSAPTVLLVPFAPYVPPPVSETTGSEPSEPTGSEPSAFFHHTHKKCGGNINVLSGQICEG